MEPANTMQEALCNSLERAVYEAKVRGDRARMILKHDWDAFCDTEADGTLGRQVYPETMRHVFEHEYGTLRGFDAFCCKADRLFIKYIKATDFSESDKLFLVNTLKSALALL